MRRSLQLYLVIKDHKPVEPGQLPKTRPIVAANQSMCRHLAGILSDIIEGLANAMEDPLEAIRTEDTLAIVEEYNANILAGEFGDVDPVPHLHVDLGRRSRGSSD